MTDSSRHSARLPATADLSCIRRCLAVLAWCLSLSCGLGAACFEPFADATADGGTPYSAGSFLFGSANSSGTTWYALTNTPVPPATGLPLITLGNLSYPGLPAPTGNSVSIPPGTGIMGRMTLNFTATNGTAYFSFLLKVLDLSGVNTSGTQNNFFAGFGDTIGNQNATLLRAATRVYTRRAGTGFNLGVARNSNATGDWVFDTTQRNTNEVLFVVGSYDYNNHTANLWINPPAVTFGSNAPPAPTITATRGNDLNANGIHAFVLGCRTNPPPGCVVDELRIGTAWASVTGGPDVVQQPTSRSQNAGTTATFSVRGIGGPPLSYQWRKNGLNLSNGGNISGVTTATLSISNLLQSDAGNYSVRITNAYNSATSDNATLSVNDPGINSQPVGMALPAGTNAIFTVGAAGTAPLLYQWFKDGVSLVDAGRVSGATGSTLTLNNIAAQDVGAYSVRITNGIGNYVISSNANLYLTTSTMPPRRPNIVFVLCDDLGYGDLGVLFQNSRAPGLPREQTPNLDQFAAEGLQLRQHYCPAPICAPSRASLLLGVHQGHANVRDQQFEKALANNHTIASVLRTAGYATAAIGKWGLAGDDLGGTTPADWPAYPTKRGFDYFFGYVRHGDGHDHYPKEAPYSNKSKECYDGTNNISSILDKCYTADLFAARAKKWIADQHTSRPDQPFFLYLAFDTPHAAYELPTQAYPPGGGLNGGLQWLDTPGHMINTASGSIDSFIHPDYAAATYDHDNNPATPEVVWPEIFKRFATGVRRIDDTVGDLKKLLQDLSIDTNTLVIFTSDNGPTIEDYLSLNPSYVGNFFDNYGPFDGVKRDTWEGGIRMPTLVRWPGTIAAGQTNQTPSQFHDWMPTFADLAGLPGPARSDGVSLVPTLLGSGTQLPSTIYVEYFDTATATPEYPEFQPEHQGRVRNQMQVIGLGGYQGVRYDIKSHSDDFEIYDVTRDTKQATNLAALPSFAVLQKKMKDRVLQLRRPEPTAARPYDFEFVPNAGAPPSTNGWLDCAIYQGAWPWVPDTSTLTASSTLRVTGLDLAPPGGGTSYAAVFSGYVRVPADGNYTFYLNTDAGAVFRLHDATVIDDDFNHTNGEVSASIRLQAGVHPFRLTYRHSAGTNILDLKYSGPGISKQAVPLAAFYAPCPSCSVTPIAGDDSAVTLQNTPVTIDVLANDSDDGLPSPLSIVSVSSARAGTTSIVAGQIRYIPNPGFLGEDTFTYLVTDGTTQTSATVRVQVGYFDGSYWFPFNEASGLTTAEAGGIATAQLINFPNDPNQWVPGRFNRALNFDGESNLVQIVGFNGITGSSSRACAAWIKTTSANNIAIIGWGPNTTGNKWTFLLQGGTLRVEITGGWVQGSKLVNDGQWHHVACSFQEDATPDAIDVKLYVDGALESALSSSASQSINTIADAPVKIGSDAQDRFFDGIIDEVRIYNRSLSAAEVLSLVTDPNQSAEAWHRRYFGSGPINWTADDDADGLNRFAEYAFGGQPLLADPGSAQLTGEISANHLLIHYRRRAFGTHELAYELEGSHDLKTWFTLAGSDLSVVESGQPGFEDVVFRVSQLLPTDSPLFARLSAQPL